MSSDEQKANLRERFKHLNRWITDSLRWETDELARKLKEAREQSGLSIEKLADKAGVTPQHLRRLETAGDSYSVPSAFLLARIARAVRVDVGYLLAHVVPLDEHLDEFFHHPDIEHLLHSLRKFRAGRPINDVLTDMSFKEKATLARFVADLLERDDEREKTRKRRQELRQRQDQNSGD